MGFRILSVNDAGTFGTVVQVEDADRDKQIIGLKVLNKDFISDERVRRRTRDEARLLAQLNHPNILQVLGFREYNGCPVIEMEWVNGVTLQNLLKSWPEGLPSAIAFEITRTICEALDHAFEQPAGDPPKPLRLVHRDLKPTNVMIGTDGIIKIIDFGLAYGDFQNRESITISMVLGTRRYLAPERLDGEEDTPKGDVYALGIMLLEMLIGKALQLSLNPRHHRERLKQALTHVPVGSLSKDAAKRLFVLISKMVAYDSENRPTHQAVVHELGVIMALTQMTPNMTVFARSYIAPILFRNKARDPKSHPQYAIVQFLEDASRTG